MVIMLMDNLTTDQRIRNMKAIKSKGSKIEKTLGKTLWSKGYRYRKNDKSVFGNPDYTLKKFKTAIFVDGEFWHGKNWAHIVEAEMNNKEYWLKKIARNIERDKMVNEYLVSNGWKVLRFWGNDIKKNLYFCIEEIEKALHDK